MTVEEGGQHPEVWILNRVSTGQSDVDTQLRDSAIRVWPRARTLARKEVAGTPLCGETGTVMGIWEGTLERLAQRLKAVHILESIRDLDSYILASFVHRLRRAVTQEKAIESVPWEPELEERPEAQDWSWIENLEARLEFKEAVEQMDDWAKSVAFSWAVDELPWSEISKSLGITTNAVKKRFFYHLAKIRDRMAAATSRAGNKG
jgi:DNA-directed RNA polymerase specialized sigma24 family protein